MQKLKNTQKLKYKEIVKTYIYIYIYGIYKESIRNIHKYVWILLIYSLLYIFPKYVPYIFPCVFLNLTRRNADDHVRVSASMVVLDRVPLKQRHNRENCFRICVGYDSLEIWISCANVLAQCFKVLLEVLWAK